MKKKMIAMLLTATMAAALLAGCGDDSPASSGSGSQGGEAQGEESGGGIFR